MSPKLHFCTSLRMALTSPRLSEVTAVNLHHHLQSQEWYLYITTSSTSKVTAAATENRGKNIHLHLTISDQHLTNTQRPKYFKGVRELLSCFSHAVSNAKLQIQLQKLCFDAWTQPKFPSICGTLFHNRFYFAIRH